QLVKFATLWMDATFFDSLVLASQRPHLHTGRARLVVQLLALATAKAATAATQPISTQLARSVILQMAATSFDSQVLASR
ncbi:UNVERIFIED_CONTAM: hypothetical protein NY603_34905, partial [Bacteroidetes bacterium 56_B9]